MSALDVIGSWNNNKAYACLAKIWHICECNHMYTGDYVHKFRIENKSFQEIVPKLFYSIPVQLTPIFVNLLRDGGDINYKIPINSPVKLHTRQILGYTALHFAMKGANTLNSNLMALDSLLKLGADMTIQSSERGTPLHLAVTSSCNKFEDCFNLKGTMVHHFASMILDAQIEARKFINLKCKYGISHLHIACMLNHEKAVKFFLESGVYVNERVSSESNILPGYTPLHFAARYCSDRVIKILVECGADRHAKDAKGITPLHLLLHYKIQIVDSIDHDQLKKYIWFQRDLDKITFAINVLTSCSKLSSTSLDDNGLTYLHLACTETSTAIEESSFDNVEDVNAAVHIDSLVCPGYTPLHFAAHFNIETFIILLNHGANISAEDAKGMTPFDICVRKYATDDLCNILLSQPLLADIKFSSGPKLVDVISSKNSFLSCLKDTVGKHTIIMSSYIWSGCNLLHAAVNLAEFPKEYEIFDQVDHSKRLDETVLEQACDERVLACFKYNVSFTDQDSSGNSPLHLAFLQRKDTVVSEIVRRYVSNRYDDPTNRNDLSHSHILALTGITSDLIFNSFFPTYVNKKVKYEFYHKEDRIPAGSTALHMSVIVGNEEMTEMLLSVGADPTIENDEGFTPIHFSCYGTKWCDKMLMSNHKFLQNNTIATNGISNLHIACLCANITAICNFLKLGGNIDLPVSSDYLKCRKEHFTLFKVGFTALHIAIMATSSKAVKLLIKHGANMHVKSESGLTPLYLALQMNNRDCKFAGGVNARKIFKNLFRVLKTFHPNYTDEMGVTMLHLACACLNEEAIIQLLNDGLNVNAQINNNSPVAPGFTPLHMVVNQDNWCVKFEREYIAKIRHQCCEDVFKIANLLLQHGANVNIQNTNGETPVHLCWDVYRRWDFWKKIKTQDRKLLSLLVQNQRTFKVNPVNHKGISHFHLACLANEPAVVENFLKNGVDVNHTTDLFVSNDDNPGYSALHFVMQYSVPNVVNVLVNYGADVNITDVCGSTPFHIALEIHDDNTEEEQLMNVESLLSTGLVDTNTQTILGQSPLEMLFTSHSWNKVSLKMLKLCLARGGVVNVYNPVTSEGLLGLLVKNRKKIEEIFEIILQKQTDIRAFDEITRRNAIHNIVSVHYYKHINHDAYIFAINELTQCGLNIDHKDLHGKTPLHVAVEFCNISAINALLMLGADINIQDKDGKTPLCYSEKASELIEEVGEVLESHMSDLKTSGLHVNCVNRLFLDKLQLSNRNFT